MGNHPPTSFFVDLEKPQPVHLALSTHGSNVSAEHPPQSSLDLSQEAKPDSIASRHGRWARPECLKSVWRECACVVCICMSHILVEYYNLGFILMLADTLQQMGQQDNHSVWPIAAYPITIGALILPCGRLQDKLGSYACLIFGLTWLGLSSFIAGYAGSFWMLCLCRALSGLGPAIFLASGVKLLESLYPSGPRKHLVNYLYAISSSGGVFAGLLAAGVVSTARLQSGWFFWIGGSLSFTTAILALLAFPQTMRRPPSGISHLSWNCTSAILITLGFGLTLTSLVYGACGRHEWSKSYIIIMLASGIVCLFAAIYVEFCIAQTPLLSRNIFSLPRMNCLLTVVFIDSGLIGLCLAFGARLLQQTNPVSTMRLVLWYLPVYLIGPATSLFDFWVRNGPRTRMLIWAQYCWLVAVTLIAISTVNASYWAFAFTSMIFASVASFSTYDTASMFVYHSLTPKDEVLTSTLVNLLKHVGVASFLGIGDNIRNVVELRGVSSSDSIKSVFWFAIAAAIIALFITMSWVRIDENDANPASKQQNPKPL